MFLNEHVYDQKISSFMAAVYGWMSCALTITSFAAYYVAMSPVLFSYIQQPIILMVLFCFQLAFVFGLSFFINRISFFSAVILFLLYAFSLGITLSSIFYVYMHASIMSTFFVAALMFAAMSLYGYVTKNDLTTVGSISFMIVVGLLIAMVINVFFKSEQMDYILSGVGVILFTLLTAYDTQKIKQLGRNFLSGNQSIEKVAIFGALTLYLDFINLFLFLLRFLGKRNEQ